MSCDFKSSTHTVSPVSNNQLYLTMGKGDMYFWNMTGKFLHRASLEFRNAVKAECYMGWRRKRWEKKEMWTLWEESPQVQNDRAPQEAQCILSKYSQKDLCTWKTLKCVCACLCGLMKSGLSDVGMEGQYYNIKHFLFGNWLSKIALPLTINENWAWLSLLSLPQLVLI